MRASRTFLSLVSKLRHRSARELILGIGLVVAPSLLVVLYAYHVGQERGQYIFVVMLEGAVCLFVFALVIAFGVLDRIVALISAMVASALCFILCGAYSSEAYLAGLSRAAANREFIGELSGWIYSAENSSWLEHNGKRSLNPPDLPQFLYVWIGRPRCKLPWVHIYDHSAFPGQVPSPRTFEFGSIGIAFGFEPHTARRKVQDGVYVFLVER